MSEKYIKWDDSRVEHKDADEDSLIHEVEKQINTAQAAVKAGCKAAYSGTHVKTQGIVRGKMEVGFLPPHLAQGMFKNPGTYDLAMRYSTETTAMIEDTIPQPRGIGMKVFGIEGKKLRQDMKDPKTQDWEFNNASALELGSARVCRDIIGLRLQYGADGAGLDKALRRRDDYAVQDGRNHLPNVNVVAHRQYSQSAIRFGDYVAKFVLVPTAPAQKEALNREVKKEDGPHILKKWCQDYFKDNEATYDLQAQLLENLDDQPVEDTRKDWDQSQYPFKTIAKVTIPKQDTLNPKTVHFWENNIRVDMWHGLEEHRPLGSVNRLRKGVYKASSAWRRRENGEKEITVDSLDQIPA